ncbi:penicillin-binding protein [Penicillium riverlandense]|uniref:penicillin-binding protein n=1 Tax=Penicillium riverlandense TaxID=1903569 RepID=UPI002546FE7A|nr:penicillin-binding protein [Penicillium riverlandense]KAJ5826326.1 penicillin-binding protein [Penicillium riverlandense]
MESASEPPLNKEFEKLVHETLARWHVPGVSIAVVDGEKSWAEGYGIATFPSTPATASTLYCVGSITKAFTAAAASLLVDQGKLSWHTRLSDVIGDDFILPGEYATTRITLEDALSHRTGMAGHDLSYGNEGGRSAKEVTRSLRYLPCTAPLRTKWIYNNIMYVAAAHAIETVSGSTISDLFKAQIMNPLGMQSTYFTISAAQKAKDHFSRGYYYNNDVGEYQEVRLPVGDITIGAGGLISNVLDFAKWVRTMIKELGPMTKEGHKQIRTPRMLKPADLEPLPFTGATSYCLGWETAVYRGVQIYMHAGEVEAYGAYVVWIPCLEFGVVAFANTAVTSNFVQQVLIWTLIDNKMKTPIEERFDWNKRFVLCYPNTFD